MSNIDKKQTLIAPCNGEVIKLEDVCDEVFSSGVLGKGFAIAMHTLDGGRIGIAAQALGIAEGALERTIEYTKERKQFGRSIAAQQNTQFQLADMATKAQAAQLLVYKAACTKDQYTKDHKTSYGVEAAMAKGVHVISVDRAVNGVDIACQIASDNVLGAELATQYIVDTLGEGVKVAELEGIPGASAAIDRSAGFHNVADAKLSVVAKQTANFDRTEGMSVMENILQANGDVQAVFAANDEMALGAVEAITGAGKDIMVVGFDATDDAIEAIKAGTTTLGDYHYVMDETTDFIHKTGARGNLTMMLRAAKQKVYKPGELYEFENVV